MKPDLPLFSVSISSLFRYSLALLGGVLLCLAPMAAPGQRLTFTGAQTTLPTSGLSPQAVAADRAGDLFVLGDGDNPPVVEFPKTATGYPPQITLPFSGLSASATTIAVDGAGDVFVATGDGVMELPWTGTGYGPQTTVPSEGLSGPIASDSAGDLFILSGSNVFELPRTGTSYGPPAALPFSGLNAPQGIAADSAGDVFVADGDVFELPRAGTGYGPQITLPRVMNIFGVTVDSSGDLFVAYSAPFITGVVELQKFSTGYEELDLPFGVSGFIRSLAADSSDLFITDTNQNSVVEVQRQSVNFGNAYVCAPGQTFPVPCSQALTLEYYVRASGTLGTPMVFTGNAPDLDFTLDSGSTCTGAVAAGFFCTVKVSFAPLTTGVHSGAVKIIDGSGAVIASTSISGLGVPAADAAPVMQVSTYDMLFGTIPYPSTETLPLTITNVGGETLTVATSFSGSVSYSIAASNCGAGLTTGQSCTLQVKFNPAWYGEHDGILTIQTNGIQTNGVAGPLIIHLYGAAIAVPPGPPIAAVSTTYLPFGTIAVGTSETLPVTITNNGGGLLTVGPSSITGYSTPPPSIFPYSVAGNNCAGQFLPGSGCTLQVQFSPMSISANHDDVLTVQTNGGNPTVNLVGAAIGLSVFGGIDGAPLKFGSVASGATEVLSLTITNVGLPGTVTVGTAIKSGPYTTSPYTILTTAENTCLAGIAAGQTCVLPVEFAPTSSGTHDDLLTLTPSAGGGKTTVWLVGSTP